MNAARLVGVMGHVDHGKTTLVRALTGIDTDRLPEEKRRGVSIELGYALLDLGEGVIVDLVDMPGHERYLRAMAGGATGVEAAILVVAAPEGVRAQTREHLDIARMLGIAGCVGVVTMADRVDPARLQSALEETGAALAEAGYPGARLVACSATTGAGLQCVRDAVGDLVRNVILAPAPGARARAAGMFFLPVDRAFKAPGFGPVAAGALAGGPLAQGDAVEILPQGLLASVRGLQRHGRAVERAQAGGRVAVNLKGIEAADVQRGALLAAPGLVRPSDWLDVHLHAARGLARPLRNGERATMIFAAAQTRVRLRLLDRDELAPGAAAVCQLRCETPAYMPAGAGFVLRRDGPPATLGAGRTLLPESARRRRGAPPAGFAELGQTGELARALPLMLTEAGQAGLSADLLRRLCGARPEDAARIMPERARRLADGAWISASALEDLKQGLLARLADLHAAAPLADGFPLEAIARGAPAPAAAVAAAIAELSREASLLRAGALWRRADFDAQAAAPPDVRRLAETLEAVWRAAGLAPPDTQTLPARENEALRWLVRRGVLVRTFDAVQKREIVFHAQAIARARDLLTAAFGDGQPFLAREANATLGVSRKFGIPLLEHLDATGFTARGGDLRRLAGRRSKDASGALETIGQP